MTVLSLVNWTEGVKTVSSAYAARRLVDQGLADRGGWDCWSPAARRLAVWLGALIGCSCCSVALVRRALSLKDKALARAKDGALALTHLRHVRFRG